MNHNDLCKIAVRWLKRPSSGGGHGCAIAFSEVKGGWTGEIPDAIGFTQGYESTGSVVVEVKVSRSDFLADKKKPHREQGGMGDWRYYMAPKGMLKADEIPDGWGLVEVTPGGICKVARGAVFNIKNLGYDEHRKSLDEWRHDDVAKDREAWMLVRLLSRLGDIDEINDRRKALYRMERLIDEERQWRSSCSCGASTKNPSSFERYLSGQIGADLKATPRRVD